MPKLTPSPVTLGSDGFPEPGQMTKSRVFRCICHICWQPHGRVSLTKKGGYYLQCGVCRAQTFLSDPAAISLWRGGQRAFEESPDLYDLLAGQTAALAPPIPGAR